MADELIEEVVEEVVDDSSEETVLEDAIHDSMVITVPIDDTLSVSWAAADAHAVGVALAGKVDNTTLQNTLSVNGRTGGGSWAITVNGDNIPAQSDSDSESVADALTRIDTAVGTEATARQQADTALGTRIDNEITARGAADTALGTRIDGAEDRLDVLEARLGLAVQIDFTVAGALDPILDERFTADHYLAGVVWLDGQHNATGDVLADLSWTTAAGSLTVVIDHVWNAGSVILNFGWRADATPEEVGS